MLSSCASTYIIFKKQSSLEFDLQPLTKEKILCEEDISKLPACIQKYLHYTGAVGKAIPQNMYMEFKAKMYSKPGDKAMNSSSVQYNFFGNYSRLFFMKAHKAGIPVKALHIYKEQKASFQVKIADLFKVVDISGDDLDKAETVTILNDMCVFAPGSLTDNRLTWIESDSLSVKVTFKNGKNVVSAQLFFNENGELINFISEDRFALQNNGEMKQCRWTTPVSKYEDFEGRKIPTFGKAVWNYPEGDFTYGEFELKKIAYNVQIDNRE
jgi:hypothetical protein